VVVDEARRAKVNDLNLAPAIAPDQNVLGLQVAMYQSQSVYEVQRCQDLLGHSLEPRYSEKWFFLDFSIILGVFVQVVSEQFRDNEQMLLVVKEIKELEQMLLVWVVAISIDVSEKFDLVN
jgi:hypothetical protein